MFAYWLRRWVFMYWQGRWVHKCLITKCRGWKSNPMNSVIQRLMDLFSLMLSSHCSILHCQRFLCSLQSTPSKNSIPSHQRHHPIYYTCWTSTTILFVVNQSNKLSYNLTEVMLVFCLKQQHRRRAKMRRCELGWSQWGLWVIWLENRNLVFIYPSSRNGCKQKEGRESLALVG